MKLTTFLFVFLLFFSHCSEGGEPHPTPSLYFPPQNNSNWDMLSIEKLQWNLSAIKPLKDFLINKNTKSFMILIDGKIVMEEYFDNHTSSSQWQWNSAGKTLITATIGIAQQENLLTTNNKVSDYLSEGWTSASSEKENLITINHLLTMTSGLDDKKEFVSKENLTYLADAGTRWSYHNVFQKLMDVVAEASNQPFEDYFNSKIKTKIGMDGSWNKRLIFTIYSSSTRSMARFGLLALRKGNWAGQQIINESYFQESISTSQSINPSYGYLWWLNGKSKYMVPRSQEVFDTKLIPNAPEDMYAAMGADDQRIYVIPSKNMVVIRMGNASDPNSPNFAVSGFDYALWEKINALID